MQIVELYMRGAKRIFGNITGVDSGFGTISDSNAQFLIFAEVGDVITNLQTGEQDIITAIISDTTITVRDYQKFQLGFPDYIIQTQLKRVDLFDDESITITDSILNVRDIKKIFTPFSQQFTLPASQTNNKIFRHYENSDVVNSFDARYRSDSLIKLNGIDYKKGQILFKSVELKDNSPHSYKVVFYGDTAELKSILAEDQLSSLSSLNQFNFDLTDFNVLMRFSNYTGTVTPQPDIQDDIIYPLITHTKNMRYTNEGYRDNKTGEALNESDIKPAIKVQKVIQAISEKYPQLKFVNGFFNSTRFSKLYMWLHKNEGFISNVDEGGGARTIRRQLYQRPTPTDPTDWEFWAGNDLRMLYSRDYSVNGGPLLQYEINWYINSPDASATFQCRVIDNNTGNILVDEERSGGQNTGIQVTIGGQWGAPNEYDLTFEVDVENDLNFSQNLVIHKKRRSNLYWGPWNTIDTGRYRTPQIDVTNIYEVPFQMPKYKIIDFLSNLFKMFNLVVYRVGDEIRVEEASWWSTIGNSYDITRYCDMSTSTVERLFQFKNMKFDFKSKKSFLIQYSDELQGNQFAQESYGNDSFDGTDYNVEVDFEKMMYERLTNEDNGDLSNIGQGAMIDKKFEPTIGKPLLFYTELTNANGQFYLGNNIVNQYQRPTQLGPYNSWSSDRTSLNFGVESDEYIQAIVGNGDNLFSEGYLDYVENGFNPNSRMLKVSAYLPLGLVTTYKMNDTFVINNKPYRINKIKTNLLTNKTDLELYNKQEFVSQLNNNQTAFLGRVADLEIEDIQKTTIDIGFTGLYGDFTLTGEYRVYVDGIIYDTISALSGESVSYTIGEELNKELPEGTSFRIGVTAVYDIESAVIESLPTSTRVTTL